MPPFVGLIDNIMEIVQVANTIYFMNLWEQFIFNKKSMRIITMNPQPLSIKCLKLLFSMNTVDSATAIPLPSFTYFHSVVNTVRRVTYSSLPGTWVRFQFFICA